MRLSTVDAWMQRVWNPPVVMESWVKVSLVLLTQRASPYGEVLCFVVPVAVYYSAIYIIPNVSHPADRPDTNIFLFAPSLPGEDSQTVSYQLAGQESNGISKVCQPAFHFAVPRLIVWVGGSSALLGRRRKE